MSRADGARGRDSPDGVEDKGLACHSMVCQRMQDATAQSVYSVGARALRPARITLIS